MISFYRPLPIQVPTVEYLCCNVRRLRLSVMPSNTYIRTYVCVYLKRMGKHIIVLSKALQNFMCTRRWSLVNVPVCMAQSTMLKSVTVRTHPLFIPICYWEGIKYFFIINNACNHSIVELPYSSDKLSRTVKLYHDFPKTLLKDSVICLCETNDDHEHIMLL